MDYRSTPVGECTVSCCYQAILYPKNHPEGLTEDGSWMIVKYREKDTGREIVASGVNLPAVKAVETVLHGSWSYHERYGKTLKATFAELIPPVTEQGFMQYISALRIGLGKARAKMLYAAFRDRIWEELDRDPGQFAAAAGISREVVDKLLEKRKRSGVQRELSRIGGSVFELNKVKVNDIITALGWDAAQKVRENPYLLCTVRGFGFQSADRLARHMGFPPDDPARLRAMICHLFDIAAGAGNVCVPKEDFRKKMLLDLNRGQPDAAVTDRQVRESLNAAWSGGALVAFRQMVYSRERFDQETLLIRNLARLMAAENRVPQDIGRILAEYEQAGAIRLAENQRAAVENVFRNRVSIVTGGPGTGKTTIIKAILYVHRKLYGKRSEISLLSPTGRAARRMTEATGYPAQTIHRAVSFHGEEEELPEQKNGEKLKANLLVVDECSMMDQYIASVLLKRLPDHTRVVFVGDPEQLPSVGCGNVLRDMLRCGKVPAVCLNEIFRQAGESLIVQNAARIREGNPRLMTGKQFHVFKGENTADVFHHACRIYCGSVRAYGIDNVILLNPYRDKSELNVNGFNRRLQQLLNPPKPGEAVLVRDPCVSFRAGDRVMQMRNTETARNGDVGYILRVEAVREDPNMEQETLRAVVEFNHDGVEQIYTAENLRDLDLAYCTTIHKAQGSEYHTVILVLSAQHEAMLRRNLVYTGVTRAKVNVAILTEKEGTQHDRRGRLLSATALETAIRNERKETRYSLLAQRLSGALCSA